MKQETFPFWHFLVRGAAAIGWTAMCVLTYLALPYFPMLVVLTGVCTVGHYRLVQLFDFIFVDMEDGTDE